MVFKAMLFLLASFLLVTSRVSSNDEEFLDEAAYGKVPVPAPTHGPVKAPPPPAPAHAPTKASPPAPHPPKTTEDYMVLCKARCEGQRRKRTCIRACGKCYKRCKCVPPGTSGNREMCGKCYTDMTNPECP